MENFSNKYINTVNDDENNNCHTKSIILTPYNSLILHRSKNNSIYKLLPIQNKICKYAHKVQQINIKYEMNNNADYDNGMIISQRWSDNIKNSIKEPDVSISSRNDINELILKDYILNNSEEMSEYDELHPLNINNNVIEYIEKNIGYEKDYLIDCLNNQIINYGTATYFLLNREIN